MGPETWAPPATLPSGQSQWTPAARESSINAALRVQTLPLSPWAADIRAHEQAAYDRKYLAILGAEVAARGGGASRRFIVDFQGALDVVGLIPGVGEIADAANGLLSLGRGDYTGAGLSFASMIPLVGDAFGKGGKAARAASNSAELVRHVEIVKAGRAAELAQGADAVAPSARAYDVGTANSLRSTRLRNTQVHHVPQSREAESLVGDFNRRNRVGNEPAIRLPTSEHDAVSAAQRMRGPQAGARDLLADEIRILRNNTNAPNSALQELIRLNRDRHFWDYQPLHRTINP
ncbi:MAG TPA: hypothetical protein VER03_19690 [Bryobacteraceae bacterium]|nr:hypothetical protein [Bryobacteraceae bacterium]